MLFKIRTTSRACIWRVQPDRTEQQADKVSRSWVNVEPWKPFENIVGNFPTMFYGLPKPNLKF